MTTHVLFTYGTLLPGEPRHSILVEAGAHRLGPATTDQGYALLDLGPFPALVKAKTGQVVGELYQIDQATLNYLDRIEGHPHFYRREPVFLDPASSRLVAGQIAISYFGHEAVRRGDQRPGPDLPIIASGDWRKRR